jgi:cyclomaltodextrinase / maltogenic alpha-amylase / neopullulanase
MEIKPGLYEHFKGMQMRVIGVAKHSETLEDYVVYDHLGTDARSELWVRPAAMFLEEVEVNGQKVPRFKYIGEV